MGQALGQRLTGSQDLLGDNVEVAAGLRGSRGARPRTPVLKASEVFGRGVETIGVVDPEPGHLSRADETKDEAVRFGKDVRVLHADGGQLIDVEEAPVVDFLAGDAPEGDPVGLLAQQPVEEIERAGIVRPAVEAADVLLDEGPHLG